MSDFLDKQLADQRERANTRIMELEAENASLLRLIDDATKIMHLGTEIITDMIPFVDWGEGADHHVDCNDDPCTCGRRELFDG